MLHTVKKLKGMKIVATDGEAGTIKDIYFDDDKWAIRYFEVSTGGWLTGRKVLVSPIAVTGFDWENDEVRINVDTYRGEVSLSGFVDNEQQVEAAGKAAKSVDGVKKVTNNLQVKPKQ